MKSKSSGSIRNSATNLIDSKLDLQARAIIEEQMSKVKPFAEYVQKYLFENIEDISESVASLLASNAEEVMELARDNMLTETDVKVQQFVGDRIAALDKQSAKINTSLDFLNQTVDEIRRKHVSTLEVKHPEATPINIGTYHNQFNRVFNTLLVGDDVMLVGGAGSGKGTIARQIAECIRPKPLPVSSIRCSVRDSMSKWFGFTTGEGKYVPSVFYQRYKYGGVLLIDEMDASNPQVLVAINGALTDGFCDFDLEQVQRHPDFFVIAAANTYGFGADSQYVGRTPIDGATLNRFSRIPFDYDEQLEMQIAPLPIFTRYVQTARRELYKRKWKYILSPRDSIQGGKLLVGGLDFMEVEEQRVYGGWTSDNVKQILSVKEVKEARDSVMSYLAMARRRGYDEQHHTN